MANFHDTLEKETFDRVKVIYDQWVEETLTEEQAAREIESILTQDPGYMTRYILGVARSLTWEPS